MKEKTKLVDEEGKRLDGRELRELRPITIEAHPLTRADGSCYMEWGGNKVVAAVYGPRELTPKHLQDPLKAVLTCRYDMASFSVDERKRPGPDRRSQEISMVISDALGKAALLNLFPRTGIDVIIEVLQADAGTRCAGLTAAAVALVDAGIPLRDIPVSCAGGKIDGHLAVDLKKEEDQEGEADLPIAILPRTKEILLLQMDGNLSQDEFIQLIDWLTEACLSISELQKKALRERYIEEKDMNKKMNKDMNKEMNEEIREEAKETEEAK
jgi:exosome complex component RRP41